MVWFLSLICTPTRIQRAFVRSGTVQLRHEAKPLYDSRGQSDPAPNRSIQYSPNLSLSILENRTSNFLRSACEMCPGRAAAQVETAPRVTVLVYLSQSTPKHNG